jgi:hypothetical protein
MATLTVLPISLTAMTLAPSPVLRGHPVLGTITLNGPAPATGLLVTLSSANPAAALPPARVTVPAGQSTATFPVSTYRVRAATTVVLSAAAGGTNQTATLQILPAGITGLSLHVSRVRGGYGTTGRITLYSPAPAGGAVISLTSSHPAVAGVPATVTVPAGARTVSFPVTTFRPPASTSVAIGATYAGVTETVNLMVSRR